MAKPPFHTPGLILQSGPRRHGGTPRPMDKILHMRTSADFTTSTLNAGSERGCASARIGSRGPCMRDAFHEGVQDFVHQPYFCHKSS